MDPLKVPQTPETRLHFLDYWRIIRIRKTVILAVFLLVVITATLVTFILPESFSSVCRIKIERDLTDIDGMGAGSRSMSAYDPYFIQTEFETIQSEVILVPVIENLKLNEVWGKKYGTGGPLKNIETIGLLKGRMDLRPVRSTSLVEIRFHSEDKEEASQLANAIAVAYKDHRQTERLRLMGGGIKALEDRYNEHQEKITTAQKEVDSLRESLKISDTDSAGTAATPMIE